MERFQAKRQTSIRAAPLTRGMSFCPRGFVQPHDPDEGEENGEENGGKRGQTSMDQIFLTAPVILTGRSRSLAAARDDRVVRDDAGGDGEKQG